MLLTLEEAQGVYGPILDGKWANEARYCSIYRVPDEIPWINPQTLKRASRVYCHQALQAPLAAALTSILSQNLAHELKTFDGCFQIRDVRGHPGKPSWHSYALAIDINAKENGLSQVPQLPPGIVEAFKKAGFLWGGDFPRKDGMHFQWGKG